MKLHYSADVVQDDRHSKCQGTAAEVVAKIGTVEEAVLLLGANIFELSCLTIAGKETASPASR